MDLSTAYRYNQNMMEYYTCKNNSFLNIRICSAETERFVQKRKQKKVER